MDRKKKELFSNKIVLGNTLNLFRKTLTTIMGHRAAKVKPQKWRKENMMKKFISILLVLAMVFGMSASAFAGSDELNDEGLSAGEISQPVEESELVMPPELEQLEKEFQAMSNDELNDYISSVVNPPQTRTSTAPTKAAMKAAWLAAAQIAINKGYKCSGTLVKYSVNNVRYSEMDGIFKSKIKNSKAYKEWIKKPTMDYTVKLFDEPADLKYSLHNASIKVFTANSSTAIMRVYDRYDFDIKFMGSLFATIVNDWAALCTYTGVLNEIDVIIDFHG